MKNRPTDRLAGVAGRHGLPSARPPDAFWEDFRARAALAPQMEAAPARPAGRLVVGWATAAAVVALIVGLTVWRGVEPAVSPVILSLSAGGGQQPVFILRDDRTAAVILWVDANDAANTGGPGG